MTDLLTLTESHLWRQLELLTLHFEVVDLMVIYI